MQVWIAKWSRKDRLKPDLVHAWATELAKRAPFRCYGRADGPGGTKLDPILIGDLLVCYQTDERSIVGTCRVTDVHREGTRPFAVVVPLVRFNAPRKLRDLIADDVNLAHLPAFAPRNLNTFRPLTADDFRRMMRTCGVGEKPIAAWLGSMITSPTIVAEA